MSATNYHRWHSPVAGTIVRAFMVEGTYYSEPDSEGADAVEPMNSQSYLAHVAARAIIIIEADDPVIGLRPFAASQATVLAVASFERTSISGALGSCGWGIAARANSAIAPGRKTRQ